MERQLMDTDTKVAEVMRVLYEGQNMDYIGEPVSQLQHALQCARLARAEGSDEEMVLAALLHDIGHICVKHPHIAARMLKSQSSPDGQVGVDDFKTMDDLGVTHHEEVGARYLLDLGFSQKIAALVRGHVRAKRYFVWQDPAYRARLSEASRGTLAHQGGPMTDTEAKQFENEEYFHASLLMRRFDDGAKRVPSPDDPDEVEELERYAGMISAHLNRRAEKEAS